MELELHGWKVKVALVALVVLVVAVPLARASKSNKDRAEDWHRRAIVAEEAVGGLRAVIAERSRALNERTLQANRLASQLDSRGLLLEKSKVNVGTLTQRQQQLATENKRLTAERNRLRSRVATLEALGTKLRECTGELAEVVVSAKGKTAGAVTAKARPRVEGCRDLSTGFDTYMEQAR